MLKVDHINKLFTTTYQVGEHSHKLWECVYYTQGHGTVRIGDIEVPFGPGDIFIIPPDTLHTDRAPEGFQNFNFALLSPDFNGSDFLYFHDDGTVRGILELMHDTLVQRGSNWENIANACYRLFIQYLSALREAGSSNRYVERLSAAITANFADPDFSLDDTIAAMHISPNYARDLFVRHTGRTPLQLLTERRMENARQLLASREMLGYSVREIALLCGYTDPYYFSRAFKKYTGQSPRSWERTKAT